MYRSVHPSPLLHSSPHSSITYEKWRDWRQGKSGMLLDLNDYAKGRSPQNPSCATQ